MKRIYILLMTFFIVGLFAVKILAQDDNLATKQQTVKSNEAPLFINLTSNEANRAIYALQMGLEAIDHGHPVIIFLNVDGIRIGLKSGLAHSPTEYGSATEMLQEIIDKGGQVWACPPCLKDAGFSEKDLVAGIKLYDYKLLENKFFVNDLKTLSY